MNQQATNSPVVIAWLLVAVIIIALTVYAVALLRERKNNWKAQHRARQRQQDNNIFEAVEEARRDFS